MLTSHYDLHGLSITVVADDERMAGLLREALVYKRSELLVAGEQARPDDSAPRTHEPVQTDSAGLTLVFTTDTSPPLPAATRPAGTTANGIAIYFDGSCHELRGTRGAVRVEAARGRAEGRFPPSLFADRASETSETARRAAPEAYALVILCLTLLLRARGLLALHAAALTSAGHGVLVSASSGHGKSTMAFNLVRSGWTPVADDAVLLRGGADSVEALSYRRPFCIGTEHAAHFPEVAAAPDVPPRWPRAPVDPSKWRVDVERVYGRPGAPSCVPTVLLLPTLTGRAVSRVEPVLLRDAFVALVQQSVLSLPMPPGAGHSLFVLLQRLAQQTRPYRLLAGRDLLDEPDRTDDIVRGLL